MVEQATKKPVSLKASRVTRTWRRTAVAAGLALYLIGLGFLGGMAAERIRFDQERTARLHRYDEALGRWHAFLMQAELEPGASHSLAARSPERQ